MGKRTARGGHRRVDFGVARLADFVCLAAIFVRFAQRRRGSVSGRYSGVPHFAQAVKSSFAEALRVLGGSAIPEPTPSPLGSAADPNA